MTVQQYIPQTIPPEMNRIIQKKIWESVVRISIIDENEAIAGFPNVLSISTGICIDVDKEHVFILSTHHVWECKELVDVWPHLSSNFRTSLRSQSGSSPLAKKQKTESPTRAVSPTKKKVSSKKTNRVKQNSEDEQSSNVFIQIQQLIDNELIEVNIN
jgi:hypothetical protein